MIKNPEIIFSNTDYIVLNKPSGMIVNNADTNRDVFTLQDFVQEQFVLERQTDDPDKSEFLQRGGIVHRLDKETSGVLLVALNEQTFKNLQSQFKERTTEKEYTALCHGKINSGGEINVPIGRLPWNRMRFGVIPSGRESQTTFEVDRHYVLSEGKVHEELTLLNVFPKTGRTHQIRVHLQYAGHPIFGDSLYAGRKTYNHDKKYLQRHFLHARKITVTSPTTLERVTYEASLSPELVDFLAQLT